MEVHTIVLNAVFQPLQSRKINLWVSRKWNLEFVRYSLVALIQYNLYVCVSRWHDVLFCSLSVCPVHAIGRCKRVNQFGSIIVSTMNKISQKITTITIWIQLNWISFYMSLYHNWLMHVVYDEFICDFLSCGSMSLFVN